MQMHQLASLTQMSGKGHMRSINEIKLKWQNSVHQLKPKWHFNAAFPLAARLITLCINTLAFM